jgi:hypothetical protein
MSREQFVEANRQIRSYFCLVLCLTSCAAIGLGLALPAWPGFREWAHAHRGEGANRLLFGLLVLGVVVAPFALVPLLSFLWLHRRFGLCCPRCKRSVTLRCRHWEVLRSGLCCLCQNRLFEPGDRETGQPDFPTDGTAD